MKEIPLTQGFVALVDDEDYDRLAQHKWHYARKKYAARHRGIMMHRDIMQPADGLVVDHIDGDGLNNQRSNLRVCTQSQNLGNSRRQRDGSSRYKGVTRYFVLSGLRWRAKIKVDGKQTYLGSFLTEDEAAAAYNQAALGSFGPFARLNVIEESP